MLYLNYMAILEILQYPDLRLRTKATPVTDVKDPQIKKIIDDMFETLYKTPNCAGLSATQLNLQNPPRITVIDESSTNKQPFCLINPVITVTEGKSNYVEACMSVYPDYNISGKVARPDRITFTALDRDGTLLEIAAEGFFSRCVQHEIDHLNGIIYLDHLSSLKRKMVDKKIKKILLKM
ncbi:MAG: peptide deformylase [Gammaproteobacteria bacterium]|nr:peptide deformylase [Gammaproteobacteria bacterium]